MQLRTNSKLSAYEQAIRNMDFVDVNSKSVVVRPTPTPEVRTTESRGIIELENEISYLPANGVLCSEL